MKDDCISRLAAIKAADSIIERDTSGNNDVVKAMTAWKEYIKALPSAQTGRKKGKWLPDNNNYYEERFICSVCGKSYKVDTCMGKPMWDFCPCGACMMEDGEQDG